MNREVVEAELVNAGFTKASKDTYYDPDCSYWLYNINAVTGRTDLRAHQNNIDFMWSFPLEEMNKQTINNYIDCAQTRMSGQ